MALLGFFAIAQGVTPVGGDLNTIAPQMFHKLFPAWSAGVAYAALAVAALIPAAVMSISAANLFTRSLYREYLRPGATPREEARVSRWASLVVKLGAVLFILYVNPRYSAELQLIGGAIVLQTIPAVFFGLMTRWFHRYALVLGLVGGLGFSIGLLYQLPNYAITGAPVPGSHFGGASWPLANWGLHTSASIYVGLLALAANLVVVVLGTAVLRLVGVRAGEDGTRSEDFQADSDDPTLKRLDGLLDGLPGQSAGAHEAGPHALPVGPYGQPAAGDNSRGPTVSAAMRRRATTR
jgi:SSS family solute:Na+ symporter